MPYGQEEYKSGEITVKIWWYQKKGLDQEGPIFKKNCILDLYKWKWWGVELLFFQWIGVLEESNTRGSHQVFEIVVLTNILKPCSVHFREYLWNKYGIPKAKNKIFSSLKTIQNVQKIYYFFSVRLITFIRLMPQTICVCVKNEPTLPESSAI